MFEKEYREIIEQLKRNEDHAIMRTICENIIDILKENGVKVDGTIVKNVTRTKTLAIVDDFEVKFDGLDFTEHDKKYIDEIIDLQKRISELESELETANKVFADINGIAKRQFDRNEKQEKELKFFRDEAQKQSWRVSELDRALCVKGDLLKKANEKITELESELSVKEDLLKIKNGLYGEKSVIEILKNTPFVEDVLDDEPLSFSSDEYEEDRIDKIEKVVLGIQGFLKKETEQKIKELEEEQERLRREMAHQRFIIDLIRPLKP